LVPIERPAKQKDRIRAVLFESSYSSAKPPLLIAYGALSICCVILQRPRYVQRSYSDYDGYYARRSYGYYGGSPGYYGGGPGYGYYGGGPSIGFSFGSRGW
jgi:hypothetical protein